MDPRKVLGTVLQYMDDSDGDDETIIASMHGSRAAEVHPAERKHRRGSRAGRRPKKARNFEEGFQRIMKDYFDDRCVYDDNDFQRRFRMPNPVFKRFYDAISGRPFFSRKSDALRKLGIHSLQRVTAALRMMAYGTASDSIDEYCRLSGPSAMISLKEFTRGVVEEFGTEYMRSPTSVDLQRLLKINAARGFPGMVASIDCQHYEWKSFPVSLAGSRKGKGKKPTVVLEGIADGECWLWFTFFGLPGSLNDINVLDKSPTMGNILSGSFPPRIDYVVNGVPRNLLYFLADGIYPDYAVFVKTISNGGNSSKDKNFYRAQESVRKDVERAFGILIARWHILERPIKLWYKKDLEYLVKACVILHNMVVETRRDDYNSGMNEMVFTDEPAVQSVRVDKIRCGADNIMPIVSGTTDTWVQRVAERYHEVSNDVEHHRLKVDLIDHLWNRRGNE